MDPYACWLMSMTGTDGAWRGDLHRLLDALGEEAVDEEPAAYIRELYTMDEGALMLLVNETVDEPGRCSQLLTHLIEGRRQEPERILEGLLRQEIQCALYCEPLFPQPLREIDDPPLGLYWKGRLPDYSKPSLAIIGARMSSAYGRVQARDFAIELARNGVQIVSGMARGIDGIAGKAALEVSDDSFAVLGCGVDLCYPRENLELYQQLVARGGVISEYPPGIPAARLNFPQRNRIISGLSQALLVIEAREKSGTLITVDLAAEQGRDIFALPGRVSDSTSHGCNALIRQGAGIATAPDDLLIYFYSDTAQHIRLQRQTMEESLPEELRREQEARRREKAGQKALQDRQRKERLLRIGPVGQAIYALLDEATPSQIDDLIAPVRERLGRRVSFSEIMRAMTALTLAGLVREIRVGNYVRNA